jgi:hypothetical protein
LAKHSILLDMSSPSAFHIEDPQEAAEITMAAGKAFQPRAPISTREFFAGRWEQITTVADSVAQTGLHIVIFGERGVGKTSLANILSPLLDVMERSLTGQAPSPRLVVKVNVHQGDTFGKVWSRVFDEVSWVENKPMIGIHPGKVSSRITLKSAFNLDDSPSIDHVRRALSSLPRSVFIFDEFDRGSAELRTAFTDLIKSLSDYAVDSTVVLVGVSDTVDHLIRDHASIVRALVQIQLPRMNERELGEILENGAKALKVGFAQDSSTLIVRMSQGLPHYTHLIGLHSTREAANRRSRLIEIKDVHTSFEKAVRQAVQSIQEKYLNATHSAHRDALYDKVIVACASASSSAKDALGYFHLADIVEPLSSILGRRNVTIATFQKHINEFCEKERGPILERAGVPRAYKYRFHDPLLPPYIFMKSVSDGGMDLARLKILTSR